MHAETVLTPADLIWPLFISEGVGVEEPIASLPGVSRWSVDNVVARAKEARDLGIPCLALFPNTQADRRSDRGEEALNPDNLMCRAIRALKDAVPEVGLLTDVALDPYTSHGHDGLLDDNGYVLNDATAEMLVGQALNQAAAGADIIAPSDMMDGRVGLIREALEGEDRVNVQIMAYSAKYASGFYGPFRDAVGSRGLLKGDKSGDAALQNGDVIYLAPAGEQVAVIGSVNREAIFEIAPNETLSDAILYAGGINTVADDSRLMVLDSLGKTESGWRQVTAAEARTQKARRGDIIRILSDVGIARPLDQQPVLVTISGEVARPGRYYFRPGTKMEDVVTQAGGLTALAFPYASVITRESVKAQQKLSFDRAIQDMEFQLTAQPVVSANRAQLAQPGNLALVRSIVEQLRARQPSGRLVFDLPVGAATLPGDVIVENNDTIYIPSRPVTVGVFGAVPSPASFAYREGASIGDFIQSAGGVQQLGDKAEIFVVRANGTVVANGKRVLRAPALPGDLIYVPVDANRGEFWARLRDITGSLFGGLVGAASIKSLAQ